MSGKARFETFKDKQKKWRFRLVAANNKIIAQSEAYNTKLGANRGINAIIDAVDDIKYGGFDED